MHAAIAGSLVTIGLMIINRFVKTDLLGGFAVFGLVMALISLTFTLILQDDLFVKLRGTFVGLIGVSFAFIDSLNNGNYLGKRLCLYMSGLFNLTPKRAALGLGISSLIIIAIDLPLVFTLTTDQWIWYNSFLDGLIAMPIFFITLWCLRTRRDPGIN